MVLSGLSAAQESNAEVAFQHLELFINQKRSDLITCINDKNIIEGVLEM